MNDDQDQAFAPTLERILRLLSEGEIEIEGLIPWSSNATLLVTVHDDEFSTLAVYKPQRGERPLWDFPFGSLGMREVAAYLISEALGWRLVPPTILRQGPRGLGSVQLFVHAPEEAHFFAIQEEAGYREDLQRLATFDAVVNNADRKAGHCLVDQEGQLWAIDNSLTFHLEPKLRTVIWDFAGQPLPEQILADLRRLQGALGDGTSLSRALEQLLSKGELAALRRRLEGLIRAECFPEPGPGRSVPWPLI
ncbi:MAG: SCO1664 family protein [Anaerolineae bacterium]|nr:SCO1664 family protein [Anaerolineae bacterium]